MPNRPIVSDAFTKLGGRATGREAAAITPARREGFLFHGLIAHAEKLQGRRLVLRHYVFSHPHGPQSHFERDILDRACRVHWSGSGLVARAPWIFHRLEKLIALP